MRFGKRMFSSPDSAFICVVFVSPAPKFPSSEEKMEEGVGFEPTLGFPLSLISSQVPSTTQPPFRFIGKIAFFSIFQLAFSILLFYTTRMKDDQCEQTESRWQKMPVANL